MLSRVGNPHVPLTTPEEGPRKDPGRTQEGQATRQGSIGKHVFSAIRARNPHQTVRKPPAGHIPGPTGGTLHGLHRFRQAMRAPYLIRCVA